MFKLGFHSKQKSDLFWFLFNASHCIILTFAVWLLYTIDAYLRQYDLSIYVIFNLKEIILQSYRINA